MGGNPSMAALLTLIVDMPQPLKVEFASPRHRAHGYPYSKPQRRGDRRGSSPKIESVTMIFIAEWVALVNA